MDPADRARIRGTATKASELTERLWSHSHPHLYSCCEIQLTNICIGFVSFTSSCFCRQVLLLPGPAKSSSQRRSPQVGALIVRLGLPVFLLPSCCNTICSAHQRTLFLADLVSYRWQRQPRTMWCLAGSHPERKALRVSCITWKRYITPYWQHILLCSHTVVSVYVMHLCPGLSVCLWHRQLAEGEHRDPSQVSSLCSFWSRWGEILQIPRPVLQLCRCRRTFWSHWSYHRWRQARSDNTPAYMHVVFKADSFSVNDWEDVHCSGPQISHQPQAKWFPLETRTLQSLCLGKLRMTPKSWLDII